MRRVRAKIALEVSIRLDHTLPDLWSASQPGSGGRILQSRLVADPLKGSFFESSAAYYLPINNYSAISLDALGLYL